MHARRPDPLERLDATTKAVRELQEFAGAREPLDDVLARVADSATQAVPDTDAVTITELTDVTPRAVVCTDERLANLADQQYTANRGPCLEAARTGRTVRASVTERRDDWPEFDAAAQRTGVCAYVSAPLVIESPDDSADLVGALTVFSRTTPEFDPFDEGLLRLYTTTAAAAISNSRRWQSSRDTISHLNNALTSRAEIDQAKGILMALHGCTAEEAFARLVRESQNTNVKVNKLVHDLLTSVNARRQRKQGADGMSRGRA